jgi:hypothetical protein
MDFIDFFDIHNIDHLIAYKYLTENGTWPKGFIPENCDLSPTWMFQIAEKMAVAYVKEAVEAHVLYTRALEIIKQNNKKEEF